MTTRVRLFIAGGLLLTVAAGACSSTEETTTTTSTTTLAPTTTTEPPLDMQAHAEGLLVGIASEGEFLDVAGALPVGRSAGLVIAEDGLILTAASGVVGADRINVFVPGEEFPLVGELDAAAECVNLALVRVAHRFDDAASFVEATPPVAVASADRNGVTSGPAAAVAATDTYRITSGPDVAPGAVLFDVDGDFAGIVTAFGADGIPVAFDGPAAESWVRRMRSRDVVEQLGFTAFANPDGQPVVAAVAADGPGAAVDFGIGDVIVSAAGVDLDEGLAQLCALIEDAPTPLEVIKDGRRHVGTFPGGPLVLASARTTEQIRQAVVEISVDGRIRGTGFFVSEDGLVVTNYHVAGGDAEAALRIDGGPDAIPARAVGGSGCADIAVLQATGGGPFQYLEWAPEPPVLEEPIRVVGFPNRTDTISFQDGAVAKEVSDDIEIFGFLTNFESSAKTDGGNSGSPVVNALGEVVGVHYASEQGGREVIRNPRHLMGTEARAVVEGLVDGSLVYGGFQNTGAREWRNLDGLWGYTVEVDRIEPGSAGGRLGLQPLDEIVVFGDVLPQDDFGGFRKVCDAITASGGSPIDVVVWRFSDDGLWDGQLFGEPLTRRPDPYRLASEDGSVSAEVPGRWTDHEEIEVADADWIGYWAAENLRGAGGYFDEFGRAPGMRLMWSVERAATHTTESHLEGLSYASSADGSARAFAAHGLVGHFQRFDFGAGAAVEYAFKVAGDPDSPMIMLFVADAGHRIDETTDRILGTLELESPPAPEEQ